MDDVSFQQEMWRRLPLNDCQRQGVIDDIIYGIPFTPGEVKLGPEKTSQDHNTKRKKVSEQCENQNHKN